MDIIVIVIVSVSAGYLLHGCLQRLRTSFTPDGRCSAQVIDSVDAGYYYRDLHTHAEYLSPLLRDMLKTGTEETASFQTFLALLDDVQRDSITQALHNLEKHIHTTVLLCLKETNAQWECRVQGNYDKNKNLTGIILWLRDSTEAHQLQERMMKETRQLKQDVRQYSTILNSLPFPVWLRNTDLSIRYCNLAYSIAAEEDNSDSAGTPELHPHVRATAARALETGETQSERRHIVVEGERRLYECMDIPLKPDNIVVSLALDMTVVEKIQEELQRYVGVQSELLESVNSAMAVFGSDMRLKSFNYAYVRLWELDEVWLDSHPSYSEIIEVLREKRKLPEQANFPQFKQQHLRMFTDLIESREEIFYLPDGRTLRVLAIPHALGGILFAYEDVTDRLALERSYNTLIAVQKATLDNLHEGVVVFGEDGRLRLFNPRFLQLWKLEKAVLSPETHIADLIEKTRDLHHADEWAQFKQGFITTLLAREVQHTRIERTDNSVVDSVVVPLPDGANLITFYDVTDSIMLERSLRERNDALAEADRLKSQFLANVSYELRSPLTSISGFSEMLASRYFGELSLKQQEYVTAIHQSAQRLHNLINDILDIASIEAGYMKLNITRFNIYTMLQTVVALVGERIREHHLTFYFDCDTAIGVMQADETRIKQILFNLLSNAVKYAPQGGVVRLSASTAGGSDKPEVTFVVEDNGVGITPEEQQEIFSTFRRGSARAQQKSGAGLGLSMVKSFTGLHGGRVELHSAPGQGTRVICHFPREAAV